MRLSPGELPRRVRRGLRFLSRYGYGAAASVYLFTFGVRRARNRHLISTICGHFGYAADRDAKIPAVEIEALVADGEPVQLRALAAVDGNVSLYELVAISKLVKHFRPLRLFEIGTFDGRTTLNLAANAPADARVFTLDLPRSGLATTGLAVDPSEQLFIDKDESGTRFRGTDCEPRITQLYGDSASFDFSPFTDTDFVFVDGSHAYDYVVSDSRRAIGMLAGGGVVLWHDYGVWDGVTQALNELYERGGVFTGLRRIAGTSLVILRLQRGGGEAQAAR